MITAANWERVRALFQRALEQPPDARATFLREQSEGDEALRREVESLLVAHAEADGFLDEPARSASASGEPITSAPRLAPGSQLGAFEILDALGSGGMGEVYRARDTRLDRAVAIKVLSPDLARDPRARERFDREARVISKLTHPHICALHDVGSAPGEDRELQFLVMELLEGETLATRLARRPVSVEQALKIAIEIADALAAAHARDIVHRDLKPANIMLTKSGVKLLDFGLARLRMPAAGGQPSAIPTFERPLTSAGLVLGTLPYMAPEQVRGEEAGARADLFSFGAVLYEMLTGTRAFGADSQATLIAAILEHDPRPLAELRPLLPASLDRLVRKCLAKDPDERWQTASDLRSELQWINENLRTGPSASSDGVVQSASRQWRNGLLVGVVAIGACLATGILMWRVAAGPADRPRVVTRLSLGLPAGVTLSIPYNGVSFAVAPDGRRIVYIGVRDGGRRLFLHALDAMEPVELADLADSATSPVFSPDGQWVAFSESNTLKKISVAGGPVMVLAGGATSVGWTPDNRLLQGGFANPIAEVPLTGGVPRPITRLAKSDEGHHHPSLLPDGRSLLFTILRGGWHSGANSVAVWPADATEAHELVHNAANARLVAGDRIVFVRGFTFYAAHVDFDRMALVNEPRPLAIRVQPTAYSATPMYALAENGTLVHAPFAGSRRLVWLNRQGREESAVRGERFYAHARLSPDGTRVVTYQPDGERDLWIYDVARGTIDRLTFGTTRDVEPLWAPDGRHIYFSRDERELSVVAADRTGEVGTLFRAEAGSRLFPTSISPDGETVLVNWESRTRSDIGVLSLRPTPRLEPLLAQSFRERDAALSPDGRWLAYQSDESGDWDVQVRPFPAVGTGRWVISSDGGRQPRWSRDGRELFYRTKDGTVMGVPVRTRPSFAHGPSAVVLRAPQTLSAATLGPVYDVSPDGRRFLFIKAPELSIHSLTVVLNWDEEVKATLAAAPRH